MKRTGITLATLILFSGFVFAQRASSSYHNAIGLRGGYTSGLTFKHNFGSAKSAEFILGLWGNGFSVTGLYEINAGTGVSGLRWYYGGGGHLAVANYYGDPYYYRDGRRGYWYYDRRDRLGIGVDGIIGLEYKIPPIPFAISLDLKPLIEVGTSGYVFGALDPGLGIKFTF